MQIAQPNREADEAGLGALPRILLVSTSRVDLWVTARLMECECVVVGMACRKGFVDMNTYRS